MNKVVQHSISPVCHLLWELRDSTDCEYNGCGIKLEFKSSSLEFWAVSIHRLLRGRRRLALYLYACSPSTIHAIVVLKRGGRARAALLRTVVCKTEKTYWMSVI